MSVIKCRITLAPRLTTLQIFETPPMIWETRVQKNFIPSFSYIWDEGQFWTLDPSQISFPNLIRKLFFEEILLGCMIISLLKN